MNEPEILGDLECFCTPTDLNVSNDLLLIVQQWLMRGNRPLVDPKVVELVLCSTT